MKLNEADVANVSNNSFNTIKNEIKILNYLNSLVKRFFDIIISIIGIIIIIPVTIGVFIANSINGDKGPIFYKQIRIGKDGKQFKIYKYRTMVVDADERLQMYLENNQEAREEYKKYKKLKNDPRITKNGNFLRITSIDELPQIINVLRGQMSIVGPRPYLPKEKEDMGIYYEYIISCKPGITGMWQVSGRNTTTFQKRLEIESKYADYNTVFLDLKIIYKTIKSVLKREGAA